MKKIVMLSVGLLLYAQVDTKGTLEDKTVLIKEYQEMFKKISQKRVGLNDDEIARVKSPFIKIVKKKGTKSAVKSKNTQALVLDAILGNKVMINGTWYRLYQNIGDLRIVAISGDTVYLRGKGTEQKLTIRKKNANITIK